MKGTNKFKETIKAYLDNKADEDELFARKYHDSKRTIDEVVTYIFNQVKDSGCCGFADDEIYSMAMTVIDNPDLDVGKPTRCQVVVNHQVQFTDDEKAELRNKAREQFLREEMEKMHRPKKVQSKSKAQEKQPELLLFDM